MNKYLNPTSCHIWISCSYRCPQDRDWVFMLLRGQPGDMWVHSGFQTSQHRLFCACWQSFAGHQTRQNKLFYHQCSTGRFWVLPVCGLRGEQYRGQRTSQTLFTSQWYEQTFHFKIARQIITTRPVQGHKIKNTVISVWTEKMLLIFIAAGAGGILVILLIAVGVCKKR